MDTLRIDSPATARTAPSPEQLRVARRRVNARIGLMIHAAVFVAVNLLLAVLWAAGASGRMYWPGFPLAGWSIGLAIHAAVVLLGNSGVRERMVARELQRELQRAH